MIFNIIFNNYQTLRSLNGKKALKESLRCKNMNNMKRKILLWVTFILMLCAINVFGQTTDLVGRVVDENGAGIAGANVVLKLQGINFERFAVTDQSGDFSFDRLPNGSFEISINAKGFAAETQKVSTENNIEITLHPEKVAEYVAVTSSSLAGTSEALE